MSSFFVTGTDTNVGKTIASRAIIQALQNKGIQIVGYKPIAWGEKNLFMHRPIILKVIMD
ncbi:dethiobiotin synthetase [Canicola haemoglobinophilus]|uniref:Dethiobiotin synthetase n=1 Tax=Canicola haemoglobinophilus TaxID=733 RepID=A0A377HY06_9PAST|nr:dethiobiotin synthetase [Canicola haemoglobinophilus]